MIDNFVVLILSVFNSLLTLLLKPIDILLGNIVPNYDSLSANVVNLFNYLYNFILYILSWVHLPSQAVALLVMYLTFKVTLFFGTLAYKLVVKWYHILKS